MSELLLVNVAELATPLGSTPRRGREQGAVRRTETVEILCRDGRIAWLGPAADRARDCGRLDGVERLDAGGGTVVPGFVDAHTHLPWHGTREHEFVRRLAGTTYQEIAHEGGGILATVRSTRAADEDLLVASTRRRLDTLLAHGTTTAEAKSGYGLTLEDELKQLRAIRRAAADHAVDLVPTLLAAHEVPPEYRGPQGVDAPGRERWVSTICEEIVPRTAEAGLARFCDVFCERGIFSADESRRILVAGRRHGLLPRLHADEFADSGGAELAAELGAFSADHLMAVSDRGLDALATGAVVATLLPGTSFFLMKKHYAPARRMIESGVAVALGTDCNPGSCHTESLPAVIVVAVLQMGLTIEEALTAATLNAACTLGLGGEIGSVEVGKAADLVVLDAPNLLHLVYHWGVNPVRTVVKGGVRVHG
jgi:imidazolonepropionase